MPFTPTHRLDDGTEVAPDLDRQDGKPVPGLWRDAQGNEIEAPAAEPIQKVGANAVWNWGGVNYDVAVVGEGRPTPQGERTALLSDGQHVPIDRLDLGDEAKMILGLAPPKEGIKAATTPDTPPASSEPEAETRRNNQQAAHFVATHRLDDGTLVAPRIEDGRPLPGIWIDENRNLREARTAAPLEEPYPNATLKARGAIDYVEVIGQGWQSGMALLSDGRQVPIAELELWFGAKEVLGLPGDNPDLSSSDLQSDTSGPSRALARARWSIGGVLLGLAAIAVTFLWPAALGSLIAMFFPSKEQDPVCSNAEWVIQEASLCAYYPQSLWAEWSRLEKIFNVGPSRRRNAENCPGLIAGAESLGLARWELEFIGRWTAEQQNNVLGYWRKVRDEEFCEFIRDTGKGR